MSKKRDAAILGLILMLTLACYLPHTIRTYVSLDLVSYEPVLLTPRPLQTALKVLTDFKGTIVPGYYAPLGSLTLISDKVLAGYVGAKPPKVTFIINLLLHCLNGLLIWWLLRVLGFGEAIALVSVFIFLIHPMQVSVVAWFAERKTLLATACYLLCYVLFVKAGSAGPNSLGLPFSGIASTDCQQSSDRTQTVSQSAPARRRGIVLYVLSLMAFVAGLLTKPTISVFPLVCLWTTIFSLKIGSGSDSREKLSTIGQWIITLRSSVVPLIPFFGVAILIGSVAVLSEPNREHLPYSDRLPLVGATILFYIHNVIAPVDLMYMYPKWNVDPYLVRWWLPFLGVAAGVILLFRYRRKLGTSFTWGVGSFLIPLLPAAGIVNFGFFQHSYVANHLAYLSMIGAAACMAYIFIIGMRSTSQNLNKAVILFAAAYSLFLVGQTWSQTSLWASPLKLWEDNVRKCPSCPTAQSTLGVLFINMGRYEEGLKHLENAIAGHPDSAIDYCNIGQVKAYKGDLQGAMPYYRKAIELKPSLAKAHNGLGVVLQSLGDTQHSLEKFQRAVDLAPHFLPAQFNLAVARHENGEFDEAISHYQEVLLLDPSHLAAHNNIGDVYLSVGQLEKAQDHFKKALQIRPDSELALKNLERVREEIRKKRKPSEADALESPTQTP